MESSWMSGRLGRLLKRPPIEPTTCFAIIPIDDEEVLERYKLVALVHNRREIQGYNLWGGVIWGKPEGRGMPGGGLKEGETLTKAVEREVLAESGIPIVAPKEPILFQKKLIISDHETGRMFHWQYIYDDPIIPSIIPSVTEEIIKRRHLKPQKIDVVINPIYTFIARPRGWRTSKIRQAILDTIWEARISQEQILSEGIHIEFADPGENNDEVLALGISEYEEEIKGVGLYPVSVLMEKFDASADDKPKILSEAKVEEPEVSHQRQIRLGRNNVPFYYLHLERIRLALQAAREQNIPLTSYYAEDDDNTQESATA